MTNRQEEELRDLARLLVRSGLGTPATRLRQLAEAVVISLPHQEGEVLARAWLTAAERAAQTEQDKWPARTDHDQLADVFDECEAHGVRVLRGIDDHWQAKAELERLGGTHRDQPLRGILWFTQTDVWHAIDAGMLEVNLWHSTTANATPGDHLLQAVLGCFGRHGLDAHFDEGRIEVAAHWRRRIRPER